ncbi:MAG: class I SAM-dependent methyltransferase [Patescibacteria group bacterium]
MAPILYLLVFIAIILLLTMAVAGKLSAPYVPTKKDDLKRIVKLAGLTSKMTFCDLGCGDGRVVAYVAKFTRAEVIGIELAIPLYCFAKIRQQLPKKRNLKIVYGNFLNMDLSRADIIYIFGFPKTLQQKISAKIKRNVKSGAKIISYFFKIPDLELIVEDQPRKNQAPIYVYKI